MQVMKTPRSVDIEITNKCNLRCLYCSHFTSASDVDNDLPKDEWLKFFDELNRCSIMSVTLSGGEPFVRKDIRELIEGIVKNRMRYSILTNGTLVTDDMAAFISSTKRCDYIQVSIDGSTPESHDICRGKGSFKKAMDGIANLQRYHIPLTVRVTIHKGNVGDLENIAHVLLDELGLPGFSTNSASYFGMCRGNARIVQLDVHEAALAMKTLFKLNEKYGGRITALAGPLANVDQWLKMEKARSNKKEHLPDGGYLSACNGPMEKLAVRSDGIIIPCIQLSHIELGKINHDDLREIWHHHPELTKLRERRSIPLSQFEFCRDCEYIPYCTGNCPALAYTLVGNVYHPSPDACLRRFLKEGGVLPDLTLSDEHVRECI